MNFASRNPLDEQLVVRCKNPDAGKTAYRARKKISRNTFQKKIGVDCLKRIISRIISLIAFVIIMMANFQAGIKFDTATHVILNGLCILMIVICTALILTNLKKIVQFKN